MFHIQDIEIKIRSEDKLEFDNLQFAHLISISNILIYNFLIVESFELIGESKVRREGLKLTGASYI